MKKSNVIERPDVYLLYNTLKKTISKYEEYIRYMQDKEYEAEYEHHNLGEKRYYQIDEEAFQEIANTMYDLVGFIESRFME